MMNESAFVERFAWFVIPRRSIVQLASNMVDEFGGLIPLGTAYAALCLKGMLVDWRCSSSC